MRNTISVVLASLAVLSSCGGGGGGSSTPATTPPTASDTNVVVVTVDRGPTAGGNVNQPFVSVTVCAPGSTTTCQTIDHVLLDTGSTGLRLVAEAVDSGVLAALPVQNHTSGDPLLECQAFVSGYTWGSVRQADVGLGGLTASNLAIHIIGDPAVPTVPTECSTRGSGVAMADVASLGAKGILGVDYSVEDCPGCVASALAAYYTCPAGTCQAVQVAAANQVQNPVAAMPSDNNGVLVDMPAVPATGATNPSGYLVLGIGTRANNALGSAAVFDVDSYGEFSTYYNSQWYFAFADTGSNGLFFPDTGITECTGSLTGFFCPASPLALSAIVEAAVGTRRATVDFDVANAQTLMTYGHTAYDNLAGPWDFGSFSFFDWGMPFFYGRSVYYAIDGRSTPAGTGPYIAF